jgi:hypothetical protein
VVRVGGISLLSLLFLPWYTRLCVTVSILSGACSKTLPHVDRIYLKNSLLRRFESDPTEGRTVRGEAVDTAAWSDAAGGRHLNRIESHEGAV